MKIIVEQSDSRHDWWNVGFEFTNHKDIIEFVEVGKYSPKEYAIKIAKKLVEQMSGPKEFIGFDFLPEDQEFNPEKIGGVATKDLDYSDAYQFATEIPVVGPDVLFSQKNNYANGAICRYNPPKDYSSAFKRKHPKENRIVNVLIERFPGGFVIYYDGYLCDVDEFNTLEEAEEVCLDYLRGL